MYKQYLEKYAEPEASSLSGFASTYERVLLIPAFDESLAFLQHQQQNLAANTLLVIVINQPSDLATINKNNQQLAHYLQNSGPCIWHSRQLSLYQWQQGRGVLMVDRYSPGSAIERKQGVGLARKIGADIACALINQGLLKSPWIYSSDADARLAEDYFCLEQQTKPEHSAAVFNFQHGTAFTPVAKEILAANQRYEQALNYYVDGLKWAGSPYAFHTIGSCIAFTAKAYCQARGFPSRAAGEDFYLLNKLAKLGKIFKPQSKPIILQARDSQRVPFGTGPAVKQIMELDKEGLAYCYYHPQLFVELKHCLQQAQQLSPEDHNTFWQSLPNISQQALSSLGVEKFFKHCQQQCKTQAQVQQHWQQWFDAFKTLKFLHYWREHQYKDINLSDAVIKFQQLSVL